jgi:hypothetical protein
MGQTQEPTEFGRIYRWKIWITEAEAEAEKYTGPELFEVDEKLEGSRLTKIRYHRSKSVHILSVSLYDGLTYARANKAIF